MGLVVLDEYSAIEADEVIRVVVTVAPTSTEKGKLSFQTILDGKFIELSYVYVPRGATVSQTKKLLESKVKQINDCKSKPNNKQGE